MEPNLTSDALELMALGMGTVFVFLSMLVIATNFMSSALKDFGFITPEAPKKKSSQPGGAGPDPAVKQAIALAIKKYRAEHED